MNRLFQGALVAALYLHPGVAAADDDQQKWLDAMVARKDCITAIENAQVHYDRVNKHWLVDEASPWHVRTRFERLLGVHQQYRDEIDQFARRFDVNEADHNKVMEQLRALTSAHRDILVTVTRMNEADDTFIRSVNALDEAVALVADRYEGLKKTCEKQADAVQVIADAANILAEMRAELAELQGYTSAAASKRGALFDAVYQGLQALLVDRYAALLRLSLDDARRQVTAALIAESFLNKIHEWWSEAHGRKGLGDGLAGPFLQYHKPLAAMKRHLLTGEDLEREFQGLAAAHPDLARAVGSELSSRMASLRTAIKTLEERGATGTFTLQNLSNTKRKEIASELHESCLPAIKAFEQAASPGGKDPTDESRFAAEERYIDVVIACRRKQP